MKPVAIIAAGLISPLGEGPSACSVGELGARARSAVAHDAELSEAGLRRPNTARVALSVRGDRAQALLRRALELLLTDLERVRPSFREARIGVALGTSSGGLDSLTSVLRDRAEQRPLDPRQAKAASYFGPLSAFDDAGVRPARLTQVLAACASSTVAMGIACRWLEAGHCDLVIAGGYDALTLFAAAGFEALGATTGSVPRPFRQGRDGLALGEGAALVALVSSSSLSASQTASSKVLADPVLGHILGFGVGCDAVHVTAPDRTGSGLVRAARAALADAGTGPADISLISAHATATPYNDSAEARAIAMLFGGAAERVVVQPFKAVAGHTLGAAGTLETLSALDAARRDVLPAAFGDGDIDSEFSAHLCAQNMAGQASRILKLSTAFGGVNASLVVSAQAPRPGSAGSPRDRRRVRLVALGEPQLAPDLASIARQARIPELDLERYDRPSLLGLGALSNVLDGHPFEPALRDGCGVIVGTMSASLEVNELFAARLRERGARGVEPRRFPATSPNLPAGRAAIAFGLRGPAFSVGANEFAALEALLLAVELLEAGDAEALFVVALEDVGSVVRDVFRAAGLPVPEPGAMAALLATGESGMPLEANELRARLGDASGRAEGAAPGWPLFRQALRAARA